VVDAFPVLIHEVLIDGPSLEDLNQLIDDISDSGEGQPHLKVPRLATISSVEVLRYHFLEGLDAEIHAQILHSFFNVPSHVTNMRGFREDQFLNRPFLHHLLLLTSMWEVLSIFMRSYQLCFNHGKLRSLPTLSGTTAFNQLKDDSADLFGIQVGKGTVGSPSTLEDSDTELRIGLQALVEITVDIEP